MLHKNAEDDILFSNKKNVFVLDEEAKKKSIEDNSLWLKNMYLIPDLDRDMITYIWSKPTLINVKDITFDAITGKCYCFNFDYYRTQILYKQKNMNKFAKINREIVLSVFKDEAVNNPDNFASHKYISNMLENSELFKEDKYIINAIANSYEIVSVLYEILFHTDSSPYDKEGKLKPYISHNFKDKNPNRILRILNNFLHYRAHYTNIILTAIDYYGKRNKILDSDKKKGTLLKKIRSNRQYLQEQVKSDVYIALYYLFSELFYLTNIPKENNNLIIQ